MDNNEKASEKITKWLLVGISVLFLAVMLLFPLITVITEALRSGWKVYAAAVTDEYTIKALLLTVKATLFAVIFNTVFGVFAAWALTKFQFRGKKLLTTLIDLPVTISPVIAGLIFLLIFGRQSPVYFFLMKLGIKVVFSVPGIIIATVFVTFPFISRELIPVLEAEGSDEEEAAALMGAGDHFLEDHIPSYQMGITVWSCALYGKSNGRVWSGICTFRTFKRKDQYTSSSCRDFV